MMTPQTEDKLLTPTEREALKMISAGSAPHSQRAAALLAIDGGATQQQAAEQTGLTRGQVKYWLSKFRQVRLDIFPQPETTAEEVAQLSEPKAEKKVEKPAKASKKGKKAKGKKSKKGKKGKGKGKKKKNKKSKKKSK
jgi:transposase-like protein